MSDAEKETYTAAALVLAISVWVVLDSIRYIRKHR